jgi:hypothetical protein
VRITPQFLRALHLELFTKPSLMNFVFSSLEASVPGYKAAGEERWLGFGEWILPAFGIPIRDPAVTNNPSKMDPVRRLHQLIWR